MSSRRTQSHGNKCTQADAIENILSHSSETTLIPNEVTAYSIFPFTALLPSALREKESKQLSAIQGIVLFKLLVISSWVVWEA